MHFGESWVGRSGVDCWSFRLPRGHAPQCHSCPYSVAEQGEPGGGAECRTVKRGRGACWHLPSLTAAGRGKICFSICLFRALPSPPPKSPQCISFAAMLADGSLNIVYLDQWAQMWCNSIDIPTLHFLFSWSIKKMGLTKCKKYSSFFFPYYAHSFSCLLIVWAVCPRCLHLFAPQCLWTYGLPLKWLYGHRQTSRCFHVALQMLLAPLRNSSTPVYCFDAWLTPVRKSWGHRSCPLQILMDFSWTGLSTGPVCAISVCGSA